MMRPKEPKDVRFVDVTIRLSTQDIIDLRAELDPRYGLRRDTYFLPPRMKELAELAIEGQ